MLSAQMIARAWIDDEYHAELISQGLRVPPKPNDLDDEQLDLLRQDGEAIKHAPACIIC